MDTKEKKSPYPGNKKQNGLTNPEESPNPGERELLQKLKGGDPDAFREVFLRWEPLLYNYLYKLTGSADDAEDIGQETFAKLWIHRNDIDVTSNIRNYIFLIARQITWNTLRARRRRGAIFSDDVADPADSTSFESRIEAEELELLVEYHIRKLPETTRKVYLLHYKENLSHDQIARLLDISVGNVKSQIHIARKRLKDVFLVSAFVFLTKLF